MVLCWLLFLPAGLSAQETSQPQPNYPNQAAIYSVLSVLSTATLPDFLPVESPSVLGVADGSLNEIEEGEVAIPTNINITTLQLNLPNGSLNNSTVNSNTVILTRVGGSQVPANVNSSGGGDAITLVPSSELEPFTMYKFEITSGVQDLSGESMLPFSVTFTTGSASTGGANNLEGVSFNKFPQSTSSGKKYSSLVIGPDGKLYASTIDGFIYRFPINQDGSLGQAEILTGLRDHRRGSQVSSDNKILVGLVFDPSSTANDLKVWVSYSGSFVFTNGPAWDGNIALLTGSNLQSVQDVVINLPRSKRDHLTNSLTFGPDGALYFPQGSNSAMGRGDNSWGFREERLLSAAVLRLNVNNLPNNLPIDAKTEEGGTYNPYLNNAPLTIYGTGVRNAYDLVWHSNGELYVPTNGSAAPGNTPTSDPSDGRYIAPFPDAPNYTGPVIQAIDGCGPTQRDWLFRVRQGKYYGHPNPLRGEYVQNRGDQDVNNPEYDGVGPDPNYDLPGISYDFEFSKSPNGVIEYKSEAFNGKLKGLMMVCRYSQKDDVILLQPNSGGDKGIIGDTEGNQVGLANFFDPLDLVEDVRTGNVYISEYAIDRITLAKPTVQDALLTCNFTLQGRQTYNVTLNVKLYQNGVEQYNFDVSSDSNGDFTLGGIIPGSYQIVIKAEGFLQKVQTQFLNVGGNSFDFGEFKGGDANGDNVVSAIDFSILAATFNKSQSSQGYDGRADFNGDDLVSAIDFSILASNFNQVGEMNGQ